MKERRDYMFTLVRQWRDSGLTRKEFCLQHGITMAKFGYWTRRWKEDQLGGDGGFIPMGSPVTGTVPVLSVIYPNRVRLEVPSADLGLLSRLIALA
jgi:transposase-like protein